MRVVFDTNIAISGWLWSGAPRKVLMLAQTHHVTLFISEAMVDELKDVISRPKFTERLKLIDKTPEQIVTEHLKFTELIEAEPIPPTILADPDDDMILACAIAGKADYVVSGDPHLLKLQTFQGIPILDVNSFIQLDAQANEE